MRSTLCAAADLFDVGFSNMTPSAACGSDIDAGTQNTFEGCGAAPGAKAPAVFENGAGR